MSDFEERPDGGRAGGKARNLGLRPSVFRGVMMASVSGLALGVSAFATVAHAQSAPASGTTNKAAPAAGTSAPAAGASGSSGATIPDVIVRSRLRDEELQDVPLPVTAVTGQELEKQQRRTVKDFAQTSPSVTVNAPNARNSSVAIRGIGRSFASESLEPSVGVIIDNVFVTLPGAVYGNFTDLETLEIIRGPQGTLLGKNTTFGVLNISTRQPSFTPETDLELTYGNRNLFLTRGSTTGPLISDVLAYRASFYAETQDPLLVNTVAGSEDVQFEAKRWGGRVQLLFTPNDGFTSRTILEHHESDEVSAAVLAVNDPPRFSDTGTARPISWTSRLARFGITQTLDPFEKVDLNQQRSTRSDTTAISTENVWKFGEGFKFTSISAYRNYNFDALNDSDYTPLSAIQSGFLTESRAVSQEFRITSPKDHEVLGQKVDWQTGIYGLYSISEATARTRFGSDAALFLAPNALAPAIAAGDPLGVLRGITVFNKDKPETKHIAAYGQGTWHVTDQLDLTLGLRNTYEEKSNELEKTFNGRTALGGALGQFQAGVLAPVVAGVRTSDTVIDDSWSYLVNPSYKVTEDFMLYSIFSHGEKSGAVQFNPFTGAASEVDPEVVDNYELGFKSTLFDKTLRLNANVFWSDIIGYQALTAIQTPAGFQTILDNIGKVRVRGVEAEGLWKTPIDGLRISFGGAFNDGRNLEYDGVQCPGNILVATSTAIPGTCNFSDTPFLGLSRWVGNIGFDFSTEVVTGYTGYIFANHTYRSATNYGFTELTVQDAYTITDAGIGFQPNDKSWDLSLWGKNVFDTEYYTFLGAPSATFPTLGVTGDPLQFGVTFRTKL